MPITSAGWEEWITTNTTGNSTEPSLSQLWHEYQQHVAATQVAETRKREEARLFPGEKIEEEEAPLTVKQRAARRVGATLKTEGTR